MPHKYKYIDTDKEYNQALLELGQIEIEDAYTLYWIRDTIIIHDLENKSYYYEHLDDET